MTCRLSFLIAFIFVLCFAAVPALGQSPDDEVRAVIDQYLDGMRAGDSAAVQAVFHPTIMLLAVSVQDGTAMVRTNSADQFIQVIGRAHGQVWNQRIWDVAIHVDDHFATAWLNFAFYLGEDLDHCGVNAIQFLRGTDGWKMLSIVETQWPEGCTPPWEE